MKVGIIGAGFVGAACAKSMLLRGSCREIVILDIDRRRAAGLANDLSHAEPLGPAVRVRAGGYDALQHAAVVAVTAGINEKAGRAIDRADAQGRLRLLPHNAGVYADVIPRIARAAPHATILVVTDPPDALADVARRYTRTNPIISTGTFLDTLRFRVQVAGRLGCHPGSVDAMVIGEHGKSQVYVWSSARVGAQSVLRLARAKGWRPAAFRREVQDAVRDANIDIIEGTGASQHGIGVVTARIVEAILRDDGLVAPVGIRHPRLGVTLSLPGVIRGDGRVEVIDTPLSALERRQLRASAGVIRAALANLRRARVPHTSRR